MKKKKTPSKFISNTIVENEYFMLSDVLSCSGLE